MSTYQKCSKQVRDDVMAVINKHASHKPLLDQKVIIDLVFAFGDRDDEGKLLGDALKVRGFRALGITRIIPVKDRALGRGDAEIAIDGDWWNETATEEQQAALLDHELHHISLKKVKGQYAFDCVGRPILKLRKHDVEVGWFACVAERNGVHSVEQTQAKFIMETTGQYFWPLIAPQSTAPTAVTKAVKKFVDGVKASGNKVTITSGNRSVTVG